MGWTRWANPKWSRKASRQRYPSMHFMCVSKDRCGNAIINRWDESWVGSSRWYQRYTARQQRAAAKLQIAYELYEDEEWQQELWEIQCGWEDDDLELPDWWYGHEPYYECPQPEPDDSYDYDEYWYDDYFGDY